MTALEEFTLEDEAALDVVPASWPRPRRSASERAGTWVATALAAVLLGVLVAPTTAPRSMDAIPGWGGLAILVMSVEPADDVLALARDATTGTGTISSDGEVLGSVVWTIPVQPEWLSTAEALETALRQLELPEPAVLEQMETLAPGSDWLCQEVGWSTECTALDGSAKLVIVETSP